MLLPRPVRCNYRGRPGYLHPVTGRWLPSMAGAEEPSEADKEAAAKAAAEKAEADKQAAEDAAKKAADEAKLGDAGKAALDAERAARKASDKAARDAQAELKKLQDASLTETEKLKKEAEDGKALAATATTKLRQVNLRDALAEKGFAGARAKAVAKLLDGVEFDDSDEPTNLDAALEKAETEYGELAKPGPAPKPKAPAIDPGDKKAGDPPTLTADELAAAKASGMTPEEYENYKSPQPKLPAKEKAT